MKAVKNFVLATLLVSTLAFTTFAGDIETPGYVPPPPPRMSVSSEETIPETTTDTETSMSETTDFLLFETLAALLSVY
jgi:hypothetical protein